MTLLEYKKTTIFTTTTTTTNNHHMKKTAADPVDKKMTETERTFQEETLVKYRENDIVPSIQQIARKTTTAVNTVVSFMHGNSTNEKIRAYIKDRVGKNLRPIPEDLKQLFAIWDRISQV